MSHTKAMTTEQFIAEWRDCPLEEPPYLFPGDRQLLESDEGEGLLLTCRSFEEYAVSNNFGRRDDKSLHVGLLPLPYLGDLRSASIFILMLNPGLSPGDYFAEQYWPELRRAVMNNLRQENSTKSTRFFG